MYGWPAQNASEVTAVLIPDHRERARSYNAFNDKRHRSWLLQYSMPHACRTVTTTCYTLCTHRVVHSSVSVC